MRRTALVESLHTGQTVVGDRGGLLRITGEVAPSSAMPGCTAVEVGPGTLYLESDLEVEVTDEEPDPVPHLPCSPLDELDLPVVGLAWYDGSTTAITGEVYRSSVMTGMVAVETEHGTLMVDEDDVAVPVVVEGEG